MDKKIAVGLVGVIIAFGWGMVYKYQNPIIQKDSPIIKQPSLAPEISLETNDNRIKIPQISIGITDKNIESSELNLVTIPKLSSNSLSEHVIKNYKINLPDLIVKHPPSENYIKHKQVLLLKLKPIQAEHEQIDRQWQKLAKYIDISSYEEIELK